jgi:predicted amidohydrolase YtcJ
MSNFYYARKHYSTSKFKVNGVKFVFDGSIQAYTALLTAPYWVPE